MKRLLALTWKELLQIKRDPMTMKMIIMVPVMQLLIFGYAINYDVKHMETVVLDESRTFESRELVAKMQATGYFDIIGVDSFDELQTSIDSAKALVGLVIDRDFGKDAHRGAPARALLIVNASDSTSNQATGIVSGIASGISVRVLSQRAGWKSQGRPVDLRIRPWYNPELRTANFIIPGLIAIVLTFTLVQFTAISIVRERELGTLEQLQVTPITRTQLIVGKILPFVLIGYIQTVLMVLMMGWLFDVHPQGSIAALYVLTGLYIAAVLGLGILISTIAQTQMQAGNMAMMLVMPFVFLSGYVFPIGGMPQIFQGLARLVPANYAIQILRHRAARHDADRLEGADLLAVDVHHRHHRPCRHPIQKDRGVDMLLHPNLPSFARVPIALTEIAVGGVLLSAWIAFAVLGLAGAALHYAVYRRWIELPAPNTAITSRAFLQNRFRPTQTLEGTTFL